QNGTLYWVRTTSQVFRIDSSNFQAMLRLAQGNGFGFVGHPTGDTQTAKDGVGRYTRVEGGTAGTAIVIGKGTGRSFTLYGPILQKWNDLGATLSRLGYPITDIYLSSNYALGDPNLRRCDFEHGSIFLYGDGQIKVWPPS